LLLPRAKPKCADVITLIRFVFLLLLSSATAQPGGAAANKAAALRPTQQQHQSTLIPLAVPVGTLQ
jgi:hypothetical protein